MRGGDGGVEEGRMGLLWWLVLRDVYMGGGVMGGMGK